MIHAQIRKLLAESGEWDAAAYGIPLSSAHLGFASALFSAITVRDVIRLGAKVNVEERASFVQIWRCSAWLMGIPDEVLFRDEEEGLEITRIAAACDPPRTRALC